MNKLDISNVIKLDVTAKADTCGDEGDYFAQVSHTYTHVPRYQYAW